MKIKPKLAKFAGIFAKGLLILLSTLWTYWGVGEMYYEGWWGAWYNRLPYLVPATIFLILTFIVLTWPCVGSLILITLGCGIFLWWMQRVDFATDRLFMGFMLGGFAALIGIFLFLEARWGRERRTSQKWFKRNLRYIVAFTPPLLTIIITTILFAPLIITRVDDGRRDAWVMSENEISLMWAPKGPGWNFHPLEGRGRRPSWDDIALYGKPPVGIFSERKLEDPYEHATLEDMETFGLCNYLSEEGDSLMSEPQGIWRMPTTDEVVRSLIRGGENAACSWDHDSEKADCEKQPNKDTPLWAPDESPIYYWTFDQYDAEEAWYVPYTGGGMYGGAIYHQGKHWGNSRHGFRCVK